MAIVMDKRKDEVPKTFSDEEFDDKIDQIKRDQIHPKLLLDLMSYPAMLHGLYSRLHERHKAVATDEQIMDEIIHLLKEEMEQQKEPTMKIVHISGDHSVFTSYDSMATAIADLLKERGDCSPSDLIRIGFSNEEVKENWFFAYHLALFEYDRPHNGGDRCPETSAAITA